MDLSLKALPLTEQVSITVRDKDMLEGGGGASLEERIGHCIVELARFYVMRGTGKKEGFALKNVVPVGEICFTTEWIPEQE